MIKYHLYSSEGCHLCELAYKICKRLLADTLLVIDIVEDDVVENNYLDKKIGKERDNKSLVELYGTHIPVLERIDNHEKIFWPFEAVHVQKLAQTKIK